MGVARPGAPVVRSTPSVSPAAPVAPAPVLASDTPEIPAGAGIGALAVLLLLLQPFIGDRLARAAAAQLATDEEGCPWERR